MYMHAYTLYSAVRPFGCSVALGSYDEVDGPQLYMVDPSGVSFVRLHYNFSLQFYKIQFFFIRATMVVQWEKHDSQPKQKWKS
jgi:Proteasome subunit